VDIQIVSSVL